MEEPRRSAFRHALRSGLLAAGWVAFLASFFLPASRSTELVVLTEGSRALASQLVVHSGWDDFLRAGSALAGESFAAGLSWFGNLVPLLATAHWALGRRSRGLTVATSALFLLGGLCLRIPGERLLVGCYVWLFAQLLAVGSAWLAVPRSPPQARR